MHRMEVSRRRVGMILVLLLLGDFTLVQASPAHRVHLVATKAKGDPPSSGMKPLPSDANEITPSGEITPVPSSVANDDADLQLTQTEEDDLTREMEKRLQQQKEKMTPGLIVETSSMMEDLAAFDDLLPVKDDWLGSVRGLCGEGVLTSAEQVWSSLDEEDVVLRVLTAVALLQQNNCPPAAIVLATRLVDKLDTASTRERTSFRTAGKESTRDDRCEGSAECRQKYVVTVRQILKRFPALVTVYDTAATAIFATLGNPDVSEALLNDVLGNLNLTAEAVHMNMSAMHGPFKRSSCEDKGERTAQSIISWIPFIGTLYNLISAAVYAGKGCTEVAKQRAIEGSLDLVMDAATIVTGGAAAGIASGAKTLVKVGVKSGLKAGLKAGAKSGAKAFTKLGKTMLKETVKGYKNPLKGAFKEVKDTVSTVVKGVKAVPKVAKKGKQLAKQSVHKIKETVQQIGKKGTKTVDDLPLKKNIPDSPSGSSGYSKAGKNVDDAAEESRHIICKRAPPPKKRICKGLQDNLKDRAKSSVQNTYYQRLDDIWKRQAPQTVPSPPLGKSVPNANSHTFYDLDLTASASSNKELFQALQQHRKLPVAQDAGLVVTMDLAGEKVQFVSVPSEWATGLISKSKGQVGIFTKQGNSYVAKTYGKSVEKLDAFATTSQSRLEVYKAMRDAIDSTANQKTSSFALAFDNTPAGKSAKDAAVDLVVITQTAEALPELANVAGKSGRTPGSDALFRSALKQEIQAGGQTSFKDFIQTFPFHVKGGADLQRRVVNTNMAAGTLPKKVNVDKLEKAGRDLSPS
ncbi:uncharacterized protein LOC143291565 [Babylonia areolata]|uniref:uncharacterized protein LOC143291565 n=1 Tax=Babylonia areolata TaxID=304850 RepID=UPI003FD3FB12